MATIERNKTIIQETYKTCIENEYLKSLQESIIRLQIFEHLPDYNTKKQAITYTIRFIKENILDQFGSISDGELRNAKQETVAVNWLNSAYPEIEWKELFERLFGAEVAKNITEVRMTHVAYLVKIFEFYRSHSFKDIKTSILSMMSVDFNLDFIEPHTTDHYKYCSTTATKLMPDIASMLYLETFTSADILNAEQKLELMFDQLVLTFNATLNENIWVNENVREEVSMKISELNLMTNPYQGFARFNENYHKLYSAVNISTTDYVSNVIALKQIGRRRMYDTIGQSVMSPEIIWNHLAWPISSSPIRITETTTIVLPTSLIAPFTTESQTIDVFSTIGFLVSQEISRFLYTDHTSKLFVNENEDFKANMEIHLQDPAYSKKPNIYGIQLNDEDINASQRSRFVDDVALRVTFDAYDQYQSPFDKLMPWTSDSISKMFYIIASQQFCSAKKSSVEVAIDLMRNENLPNYFRINSMMMNSESFLSVFECRSGP
ncbi:hypothetical protein HA402_004928 [Bradysia odoriphaga]|nr:hypothetical protein HA402_004928 [Bradysia odoriphaga]